MAVEWIGGIPEDELARQPNQAKKKASSEQVSALQNQSEISTASEPLKIFCQMMWERKGQISVSAKNTEEKDTTIVSRLHTKGGIFKM